MSRTRQSLHDRGATILDRLSRFDSKGSPWQASRGLLASDASRIVRESVARDLQALLNMRRPAWSRPTGLSGLGRSIVTCGIPDVSAFGLGTPEGKKRFLDEVLETVQEHEPRLVDAAVVPVSLLRSEFDGVLRFVIEGRVAAEERPFEVEYASEIRSRDRSVQVEEGGS